MAISFLTTVTLLAAFGAVCEAQSTSVGNNIFESLQPLGCSRFLAILNKCSDNFVRRYKGEVQWTVFAPNDTAFDHLPSDRRNEITGMNQDQSEDYIKAFTLGRVLQTTRFRDTQDERSFLSTMLFFTDRARKQGNSASGVAGPTEYYVNGAMVLRPNIIAGRSMIQVIDRFLEIPSDKTVLAYISGVDAPDPTFYNVILDVINDLYYDSIVQPLNINSQITAFIPTKDAIAKIPAEKLDLLRNNPDLLRKVAGMHIIPTSAVYTSFVYHNEGVNTLGQGQIIFRTSVAREAVYVSGGGMTAEITQGNVTCLNGVVHFIDTLLQYKYRTALEEIRYDKDLEEYEKLLDRSRSELQTAVVATYGVTVFVPNNQAFNNLPKFNDFYNNQSLINMIVELGLLEAGQSFELTRVNGDYEARLSLTSRFNRRRINVYSQGNDTWIESGYVKARVVKPDMGVTNGFIHVIDAVPGVPTRDVPNTIFCEDWLIKSSLQFTVTGLNNYMRDRRIDKVAPCTTSYGVRSGASVYSSFNNPNMPGGENVCGSRGELCQFTVFVPNGTAIENFENMAYGKQIQEDVNRWSYVLARHITRKIIYMEQTAIGNERTFTALNGNLVRFRRATDRYAYVYYKGRQARVLHSDLAGTNGVIHIVDQVLFDVDDAFRDSLSFTSSAGDAYLKLHTLSLGVGVWLLMWLS